MDFEKAPTSSHCYQREIIHSPNLIMIRVLMKKNGIDAYLIGHDNQHMSENIPISDERLAFISGFKGSSGTAIITDKAALMWTDSRYFIQASKELEPGWVMMKREPGALTWQQWLLENLESGSVLGYNPLLQTHHEHLETISFVSNILKIKQVNAKAFLEDFIVKIWEKRPPIPKGQIYIHDVELCGQSASDKLKVIGEELKKAGTENYLVTVLEEIACKDLYQRIDSIGTLNLRGSDCLVTPYFVSYLLLKYKFEGEISWTGTLFILREKVPQVIVEYLEGLNITLMDYEEITNPIKLEGRVYIDLYNCNAYIASLFPQEQVEPAKDGVSIIEALKGVKNPREIQGFIDCHIRDGVAIVRYFAWLEHQINVEKRTDLNEYDAWMHLEKLRSEQKYNKGFSFEGISSIGPNGAIVHYYPTEENNSIINNQELYLLDNGGQYLDGTTDSTRTTHFGTPNSEEIDCYTRVLLGNLDVEMATFAENVPDIGEKLDRMARKYLHEAGLTFGHATGHGIGYFLNVHEGPHYICEGCTVPFKKGMVVSNEPGYYKEDYFGIRIENVLIVEEEPTIQGLKFLNVTLIPYERKLINMKMCEQKHIDHINNYHKRVYEILEPLLKSQNDQMAVDWLKEKCSKL